MVSPVFIPVPNNGNGTMGDFIGFVASRGSPCRCGRMTPAPCRSAGDFSGSLIIPPVKLIKAGQMDQNILGMILANVRTPQERRGDLSAQVAANQRGAERLSEMVKYYGRDEVTIAEDQLLAYTERMTRRLIESLPDGVYHFTDQLDDDGVNDRPIPIKVSVTIRGDSAKWISQVPPPSSGQHQRRLCHHPFSSVLCFPLPARIGCTQQLQLSGSVRGHCSTRNGCQCRIPRAGRGAGMWKLPSALWMYCWGPLAQAVQIRFRQPAREQ